ncbi:phosphatase PAP2 family protein [Roseburia hominis]
MNTIRLTIKQFIHKYSHACILLYGLVYMAWFGYLEKTVTSDYFVIHSVFDDFIPFIEVFIIPYLMWFAFIAVTVLYFLFTDKQGYLRLTTLMFTGMTIFLIICTIFPNGLNLRPEVFTRENIFIDLVRHLYAADTPTNVLPSLHVYNSIACYIAISHSEKLRQSRLVQKGSFILTVLIVLSTMFLKQHSVVDVVAAGVMAYFMYQIVYVPSETRISVLARQTI